MAYFDKYGAEFSDDRKTLVKCPTNIQGEYVVPEEVEDIEVYAFHESKGLTSISIPKSTIGRRHFNLSFILEEHGKMAAFHVDPKNPKYSSVDGVLFNKSKTKLIQYPPGKQGKYVIPASVKEIWFRAFCGCEGLTSITIPNTVQLVLDGAFAGCSNLKEIVFEDGFKKIRGNDVFVGCNSLKSVVLPGSLVSPGRCTFAACNNLRKVMIQEGMKKMSGDAFQECQNIELLKIPSTMRHIYPPLFPYGTYSAFIDVAKDNPYYKSVNGSLYTKGGQKVLYARIVDAKCEIEEGVKSFDSTLLPADRDLKMLILPSTIRQLTIFHEPADTNTIDEIHIRVADPGRIKYEIQGVCGKINSDELRKELSDHTILYVPKGSEQLYHAHPYFGLFKYIKEEML